MVKDSNSPLFPPQNMWQSPTFNGMGTSVEHVSPSAYTFSANMAMPGIGIQSIPDLKAQQTSGAQGLPQISLLPFQNLFPARIPSLKENISALSSQFAGEAMPNAIPGCHKGFVIFDQSGSETRLIYSLFSPPTALKPTIGAGGFLHSEHVDQMKRFNPTVQKSQEVSDENLLSSQEGEMHEDTEEINALLYSDDDYDDENDDDDDDDDDEEVTSTGHSPILIRSYGMQGQVEEISEEVHDSDGQNKRQKLVDGGYKKSSLSDVPNSENVVGVHRFDDDAESSYVIGQQDTFFILGNKQSKKENVRRTLKILEGIIPGAKDKDPLLVLDLAIDYLNSVKLKAKSLGVNYR